MSAHRAGLRPLRLPGFESRSRSSVSRSARRAPIASRAPAEAIWRAVSAPRPDDAPVTIATRPSSRNRSSRRQRIPPCQASDRLVVYPAQCLTCPYRPTSGARSRRSAVERRLEVPAWTACGSPSGHGRDWVHANGLGVGHVSPIGRLPPKHRPRSRTGASPSRSLRPRYGPRSARRRAQSTV